MWVNLKLHGTNKNILFKFVRVNCIISSVYRVIFIKKCTSNVCVVYKSLVTIELVRSLFGHFDASFVIVSGVGQQKDV
jgi:hypothetical protein